MKFKGKLLITILFCSLLAINLDASNNKDESLTDINSATIKESEAITASNTYSNLPKEEVINTLYEDPLSESFMGKGSSKLNAERNRSTSDLLSEFEGQAKVINDNTEVPDNIVDNHSKEDRERIEARADKLLKEAAIRESKDNSGESLNNENGKIELEELNKKINSLNKKDEADEKSKENKDLTDNSEEKLPDELIDGNEVVQNSDDNQSDINEVKKDWPNSTEDPEFKNKNEISSSTENIELTKTAEQIPTEDIPDYEKMQGITTVKDNNKDETEKPTKRKKEKKKRISRNKKRLKKLFEPDEPILMTEGKPKSVDDESMKEYSFDGILIPEKQPIGKRKSMIRWVLQLDDGKRIPLKSNLKLLQEVRKESTLDDYVTISGKMRTSALEKNLKYLVPEKITKAKTKKSEEEKTSDNDKAQSKKQKNKES